MMKAIQILGNAGKFMMVIGVAGVLLVLWQLHVFDPSNTAPSTIGQTGEATQAVTSTDDATTPEPSPDEVERKTAEDVTRMRETMSYPPSAQRSAALRAEAAADPAAAQVVMRDMIAADQASNIEQTQADKQRLSEITQ